MIINLSKFEKYLNTQNYSTCIYMLDEEIKNIFIQKVKNYDSTFKYVNLKDLKNKCIKYLNINDRINAIEFYNLSLNPIDEQYELQSLFNIYENITK